jgi:hypothetical protein
MVLKLYENGLRLGFESAEMSRILEDNTASRTLAEMAGGQRYKTHRIYQMAL